jgi:two-component system, NarL family, nitrate/nitrite response regulator NarL
MNGNAPEDPRKRRTHAGEQGPWRRRARRSAARDGRRRGSQTGGRTSTREPGSSARAPHAGQGAAGPPRTISVLLVDDHALLLEGLRILLRSEDGIEVIGRASDGRRAVAMVTRLRPDVVVMDIAMPRLNGIEATRQILAAVPTTRVLILSAHGDEEYIERAMKIGASGYLLKESTFQDLATAVRTAWAGGTFVSSSIARRRRRGVAGTLDEHLGPPVPVRLTVREAEVLQMIAEGRANKQTAAELGISIKTVEKHRQSLMTKLDIHDVAGLTRYAISVGSIEGRNRSATS